MKIKTLKNHRRGRTCTTSIGDVKFDISGVAEIKDSDFESLKKIMRDIEIVPEGATKKVKTSEEADASKSKGTGEDEVDPLEKLSELSKADLLEIALTVPGVNDVEVNRMSKQKLIDFIIDAEAKKKDAGVE